MQMKTTSATGTWNRSLRRRARGLTLLELVVVLAIVGIILSYTVVATTGTDPGTQLRREAQRLAALLEAATEQAVLSWRDFGLHYDGEAYRFLTRNDGVWMASEDRLLRRRELAPQIDLQIRLQDLPATTSRRDGDDAYLPQVYLLAGGETIPFAIHMRWQGLDHAYRIHSDGGSTLGVERIVAGAHEMR